MALFPEEVTYNGTQFYKVNFYAIDLLNYFYLLLQLQAWYFAMKYLDSSLKFLPYNIWFDSPKITVL